MDGVCTQKEKCLLLSTVIISYYYSNYRISLVVIWLFLMHLDSFLCCYLSLLIELYVSPSISLYTKRKWQIFRQDKIFFLLHQ
jgi:hypothetical protein